MVEGLTCFRVDISQKEESMVVFFCHRFFVLWAFLRWRLDVVTYPPDPLPLGIYEGKGVNFLRGAAPLFCISPAAVGQIQITLEIFHLLVKLLLRASYISL